MVGEVIRGEVAKPGFFDDWEGEIGVEKTELERAFGGGESASLEFGIEVGLVL